MLLSTIYCSKREKKMHFMQCMQNFNRCCATNMGQTRWRAIRNAIACSHSFSFVCVMVRSSYFYNWVCRTEEKKNSFLSFLVVILLSENPPSLCIACEIIICAYKMKRRREQAMPSLPSKTVCSNAVCTSFWMTEKFNTRSCERYYYAVWNTHSAHSHMDWSVYEAAERAMCVVIDRPPEQSWCVSIFYFRPFFAHAHTAPSNSLSLLSS